jgi:hypothetical protein
MASAEIGIWIGAILTIFVFTFVVKENFTFRFAEHTLIAFSSSYFFILAIKTAWDSALVPLVTGQNFLSIIPLLFGALLFTKYFSGREWMTRWSAALLVGIGVGVVSRAQTQGILLRNIVPTLVPFIVPGDPAQTISNIVLVTTYILATIYFLFTFGLKGRSAFITEKLLPLGRKVVMINLGYICATQSAYRFALLMGRIQFLLWEWLKIGVGA